MKRVDNSEEEGRGNIKKVEKTNMQLSRGNQKENLIKRKQWNKHNTYTK